MQQPVRLKHLLAKLVSLDYILYDAYSNHIIASESSSITNVYVRN
jgi:hypothetical protein